MAFRWLTGVLHGRWWASREEALSDALGAGQAVRRGEDDKVSLREFATLEERGPARANERSDPSARERPPAGVRPIAPRE